MLAAALEAARQQSGLSQRGLADKMGYRSSVVISHMATGRVPIPVDRVNDFAAHLDLDPAEFLTAVLEQRFPDIDFSLLASREGCGFEPSGLNVNVHAPQSAWVQQQLEDAAGQRMDEWSSDTVALLRDVLAASSPRNRWLTANELSFVTLMRSSAPRLATMGLSRSAATQLERAFERLERAHGESGLS